MKQHDDSSQEHTGVGMAPTLGTKRTSGLALRKRSLSSLNGYYITVLQGRRKQKSIDQTISLIFITMIYPPTCAERILLFWGCGTCSK